MIQIAGYSFKKTRPKSKRIKDDRCEHKKLILNQHGNYVECETCGKQVSTFWALELFVDIFEDAWSEIVNERKRIIELSKEKQYLRVLNEVNRAWRGKDKMAVCCPHCDAGILPQDGFGESQISPELEIASRNKKTKLD